MSRPSERCCRTWPSCSAPTGGSSSARPRPPSGSTTTTSGWPPAAPPPTEFVPGCPRALREGDDAAMRAMVIDDSRAMRMILKRIVTKLNFDAVEAGDGQEALNLLADMTEVPELALIDWNMPNMNGLEFVTRVRSAQRLRAMPRVL